MKRRKRNKRNVSMLFLLPSLGLYVLVKIIPMIQGLFYSLTNWDGISKDFDFIGLQNFSKAFHDTEFFNSLLVTFKFVIIVVVAVNVLAIIFAVLLNNAGILTKIFRSIFFLPIIISRVAIAYIWKNIYSYNGLLDFILEAVGLESLKQRWLSDPSLALYSVSLTEIWRILGYHIIIILATLQTIPRNLYEACEIDGGNAFAKFRYITLPLLRPGITASVIMCTIGSLKQFATIKILTDGGPLGATNTISLYILDQAFEFNYRGYASALALILFVIILIITVTQNIVLGKKEVEL
ncbi:MAG: sugar ABC transporter permease [Vallitalea sp.]|jgi:ABC-type sugar transport system permease subunit|nr:sugar ABC transporter permease [Vallitalea sp.]